MAEDFVISYKAAETNKASLNRTIYKNGLTFSNGIIIIIIIIVLSLSPSPSRISFFILNFIRYIFWQKIGNKDEGRRNKVT